MLSEKPNSIRSLKAQMAQQKESELQRFWSKRAYRISCWRLARGFSAEEWAQKLGIHRSTLIRYEMGGSIPNVIIKRMAEAGVPRSILHPSAEDFNLTSESPQP